jgi:hypothetical protein
MSKFPLSRDLQIQLLMSSTGERRALNENVISSAGRDHKKLTFNNIFDISPNEVMRLVQETGWRGREIYEVSERPGSSYANSANIYITPLHGGACMVSRLGDKGEWFEDQFATLELARAQVINEIFHMAWSGWNARHRDLNNRSGQRLGDLYPPSPVVEGL